MISNEKCPGLRTLAAVSREEIFLAYYFKYPKLSSCEIL